MSVVAFERKQNTGEWSEKELSTILAALSAATSPGTGREWETGVTEKGDVQFYLLSPLPDQACELCVSPRTTVSALSGFAFRESRLARSLEHLAQAAICESRKKYLPVS